MNEGSSPTQIAALAAWLAAPSDRQRLAALAAASVIAPVSGSHIDHLPAEGLTALQRGSGVRFTDLRPSVRAAVLITGLGPLLGLTPTPDERRDLEHLPFMVHIDNREVVVDVNASAEARHGIGQPFYHQWVAGVSAAAVVVDCHRLDHVNSVLIAWMLQIVQSGKPMPIHIRRARTQVVTQLRQLRLDHLMVIA